MLQNNTHTFTHGILITVTCKIITFVTEREKERERERGGGGGGCGSKGFSIERRFASSLIEC